MSAAPRAALLACVAVALGIGLYFASGEGEDQGQIVTVERVIDGDTFTARTESGDNLGRVRVLGIDTPELARDGQPVQCHAQDATTAAAQLLAGQTVQITHDPTQDRQDVYGRLLVYVDIDGADYAQTMLSAGHARLYDRRSSLLARQASYENAASEAQRTGAGLWSQCP